MLVIPIGSTSVVAEKPSKFTKNPAYIHLGPEEETIDTTDKGSTQHQCSEAQPITPDSADGGGNESGLIVAESSGSLKSTKPLGTAQKHPTYINLDPEGETVEITPATSQ